MTHPVAVEAVAQAIRDFRHIPDAGDGYPAIRMGDDTDLARVAVDALVAAGWAPRAEVAEEIAQAIETDLADPPACAWTRTEAAAIARDHEEATT